MRRATGALLITLALAILAAGGIAVAGTGGSSTGEPGLLPGAPPPPSSGNGPPPRPERPKTPATQVGPVDYETLVSAARAIAGNFGEPNPQGLHAVTGLRQSEADGKVVRASVQVDGEAVVDVVQETGNFTVPNPPRGHAGGTGHVLTIAVDRATGRVTDISLALGQSPAPNLAGFGHGAAATLE